MPSSYKHHPLAASRPWPAASSIMSQARPHPLRDPLDLPSITSRRLVRLPLTAPPLRPAKETHFRGPALLLFCRTTRRFRAGVRAGPDERMLLIVTSSDGSAQKHRGRVRYLARNSTECSINLEIPVPYLYDISLFSGEPSDPVTPVCSRPSARMEVSGSTGADCPGKLSLLHRPNTTILHTIAGAVVRKYALAALPGTASLAAPARHPTHDA